MHFIDEDTSNEFNHLQNSNIRIKSGTNQPFYNSSDTQNQAISLNNSQTLKAVNRGE